MSKYVGQVVWVAPFLVPLVRPGDPVTITTDGFRFYVKIRDLGPFSEEPIRMFNPETRGLERVCADIARAFRAQAPVRPKRIATADIIVEVMS